MTPEKLDPIARKMIDAYRETGAYSVDFRERYGLPPTMLSKVQHHRSVLQAFVLQDERYALGDAFMEYGRVLIEDPSTDTAYLVRSDKTVGVERVISDTLFSIPCPVTLLVYRFHALGMDLATAPTRRRSQRSRVLPAAPPSHVGTWFFDNGDTPGSSFDQGANDLFPDVGDLRDDEGEVGER